MKQSVIVLIEDNADDAYLAMRVVGKVCQDEVLVARDGEEAVKLLERLAADPAGAVIKLVLLDLKLPKLGGIEVLQIVRNTPVLEALPVVILTSSDNDRDQEICRKLGILEYLYKPMTVDQLQRVLARDKEG